MAKVQYGVKPDIFKYALGSLADEGWLWNWLPLKSAEKEVVESQPT